MYVVSRRRLACNVCLRAALAYILSALYGVCASLRGVGNMLAYICACAQALWRFVAIVVVRPCSNWRQGRRDVGSLGALHACDMVPSWLGLD